MPTLESKTVWGLEGNVEPKVLEHFKTAQEALTRYLIRGASTGASRDEFISHTTFRFGQR